MNRKLVIHLCILAALACFAGIISMGSGPEERTYTDAELQAALESGEAEENPLTGDIVFKDEGSALGREGWDFRKLLMIPILVAISGYAAILFIVYALPMIVGKFTSELLGSEEEIVEDDPMRDARALFAQGDFAGAIEAYKVVAAEQPQNRFPWIEIAKIQHDNLEDTDASLATLKTALESHEWRVNDAAFFMFRIAEMYEKEKEDVATAIGILQQVAETFPETRHSANATHRLRELGAL